jgi:endo-1,4-beta-xylanase
MKKLKTGLFLALLVCTGILVVGCTDTSDIVVKVTIKFDADGGSPVPKPVIIKKGSNMGSKYPEDPKKENFVFDGWHHEGTQYRRSTPVNANLTLKAEWGIAVGGISLEKETLTLTMFSKEKLKFTITPPEALNKNVTWTSDTPNIVSVSEDGIVKALNFTENRSGTDSSAGTGTAIITVKTEDGEFTDTITVTTTMASQTDMMTLPPMKDQFADYFMMGNIVRSYGDIDLMSGAITNTRLTRHFNVLTAENVMKPSYYGGSRSDGTVTGLGYTQSDNFVNAATTGGFKVHAHVLLWHSQNGTWINAVASENKETAIAAMKSYITQVVDHFKGKIYSWDVLNEAFPDGVSASNWKTSMRSENPWFKAIGSDFVYEGFKAARLADPVAILYYNDYNLNEVGKSTLVANMVSDVNEAWKTDKQYDNRLLIEGIGMQSHHNTGVSASSIRASLNRFKPLGVIISISELDVLSGSYNDYSNSVAPANSQKLSAANLYGQYFDLFFEFVDIIERVTFWGVYDAVSWRARSLPLPFEGNPTSLAKPAYYKIIESLEKQQALEE